MIVISLYILLSSLILCQNRHREGSKPFNPDLAKAKSLVCYQCNSSNDDLFPLCESQNLRYWKSEEKTDLLFICPPNRKSFCFLEITDNSTRITRRGCFRDSDSRNIKIKTGCVDLGVSKRLCFCNTNKCNGNKINMYPNVKFCMLCFFSAVYRNFNKNHNI